MKSVEQIRINPIAGWAVGAAAGALALTGCSNGEASPQPTVTVTAEAPSAGPVLPSTSNGGEGSTASYQFNYRDGNSTIIQVYPGTSESGPDTISNGTFNDGETYAIDCQEKGRTVETGLGGTYAKSDIWYRLLTGTNPKYYASKTYGDVTIPKGVKIPQC